MSAVVKRAKQDAEALAVDDGDGDDDDIDLCALSLFLLSFVSLFGCFHPSCSLPSLIVECKLSQLYTRVHCFRCCAPPQPQKNPPPFSDCLWKSALLNWQVHIYVL